MKVCSLCRVKKQKGEFFHGASACKVCTKAVKARKDARLRADIEQQESIWLFDYFAGQTRISGAWPEEEEWQPVVGYEGRYEISNNGRVRSFWFRGRLRKIPHVLKATKGSGGYLCFCLTNWSVKKTTRSVHSLLLEAFVGTRPSDRHIGGHRDGNPFNNTLDNLGWITYEENEDDKKRHGRHLPGERNHQAKLTEHKVRLMRHLHRHGHTSKALGKRFGISHAVANKIVNRKGWAHVS